MAFVLSVVSATSPSADATRIVEIAGVKCAKAGTVRKVKTTTYLCTRSGGTLRWRNTGTSAKTTKTTVGGETSTTTSSIPTTTTSVAVTSTTVRQAICRTTSQIYARLPNELQKREWESVVAKLQPLLAIADSSGKTTAEIDTFDDTQVGSLEYGRYYSMAYPAAVSETNGGRCAYLALVFGLFVRFTGADTSDETARAGIYAAVKLLVQEFINKYTKVDGYEVDVLLIEPTLDYCPGRQITGQRTICPWNDNGFLYFRTASLTTARVVATPANEIFTLGVPGAIFPPRPFVQIVGIGPSSSSVTAGSLRELVPIANKSHQASTYIEFSNQTKELGQTISIDSDTAVGSITIRTVGHVGTVDGRRVSSGGPAIPATIQTRIYRYGGVGDIPTAVRRSEFTKQVDVVQSVSIPHYSSVTLNLPSGVLLSPGKYLVTFTVSDWDSNGSYLRLESMAEGPSQQTDVYAGGRAYRTCSLRTRIGYRLTDTPSVVEFGTEPVGGNCESIYAEVSKGENPARGTQHTWVWSDLAMTLNRP